MNNCGLVTLHQVLPVHQTGSIVNVASPKPRFDLTRTLVFVSPGTQGVKRRSRLPPGTQPALAPFHSPAAGMHEHAPAISAAPPLESRF